MISGAKTTNSNRLSVFALVMINTIAVASLRTLPFGAKLGSELIAFYAIGFIGFLIPVGLITAELATTWPQAGGIYVWVSQAFGPRWGFCCVWLQWLYNLVWYPTILCFMASTLSAVFAPSWINNKLYTWSFVQIVFWGATFCNGFGLRVLALMSTLGTLVGTLLPFIVMSVLTTYWLARGFPSELSLTWQMMWPDFKHNANLNLLALMLFGLMGLEMSAVHAQAVKNPARDFPRALLISCVLISLVLVWGSLSISIIVPNHELNLITGIPQAYAIFFQKLGYPQAAPWLASCLVLGALCSVMTWIIGPTQGLMIAAQDSRLPARLKSVNQHGAPMGILIIQALIVTLLSLLFLGGEAIETVYIILAELTSILALLMYFLFFAAAIVLRLKFPRLVRPFKVPGGIVGLGTLCVMGSVLCALGLISALIPPSDFRHSQFYALWLLLGAALLCAPAFYLSQKTDTFAVKPKNED